MSFVNQIKSFIQTVSLTGIHWVVDSNHWAARQLWMVIVFSALILSVYYSWSVSYNYLKGTSFTVDYSIDDVNISETGLVPFPEFVFCLQAPWDVDKSKEVNMSLNLLSYMPNIFYPFGNFTAEAHNKKNELDKEYKNILNKTGWSTVELLNKITVSCAQVVEFCNFGFRTFMNGKMCCSKFFADPEYGMMGKCFRSTTIFFNISLKEAGFQSSLFIRFVIQSNILTNLNPKIVNFPASFSDGMSLAVSNKDSHLSTLTSSMKGLVPNSWNVITVKKITIDRSERNSPFGSYNCISKSDLNAYQAHTPGYIAYTKDNCIVAQKQNLISKQYNCSLLFYKAVPGTEYCGPTETTIIYFKR